jgi:hypothetical protein
VFVGVLGKDASTLQCLAVAMCVACRRDRLLQRLGVAEGDDAEARREWPPVGVSVLKPTIPRVRPWKLSAQTMISEGRKLIAE